MNIDGLGEFGLIERIREGEGALPRGIMGIGDDCAVLPQRKGYKTLVSTDLLMEGVHFLLEDIDPYSLGWKSAAVNLSDIAAMGGRPLGSFLAFALPKALDSKWMDDFFRGYRAVSGLCSAPLLGGDTTSSLDRLCICVTVLGECEDGHEVLRSGARPSDKICVSGTLGDSAGGLKLILGGLSREGAGERLIERHYRPVPRVAEGQRIAACGATSMMDISDGIGSDLRHITRASGVGAVVRVKDLPLSEELLSQSALYGWNARGLAIDGGEDYELLFTMPSDALRNLDIPYTEIGEIVPGEDILWEGASSQEHKGFRHF